MNRISLKAILLATLVMVAIDFIIGLAMMFMFMRDAFEEGLTEEQVSEALLASTQSASFLFTGMILGTLSTIVAGYVAARIAKTEPYINAGVVGLLGMALGALFVEDSPLWFNVMSYLLILPAALLGGYLAARRVPEKA